MKVLITSGGTKIPIDRVRSITNMSRGTFGSKIADSFFRLGREREFSKDAGRIEKITFFMAKDSRKPMAESLWNEAYGTGYWPTEYAEYSTFDEYRAGVAEILKKEKYDVIVAAAAVSDYGVANYYDGKYRSREDDMCIKLVKLPKILPEIRALAPDAVLCGFKLLVDSTDEELAAAMKKQIEETGVDLVVGNDLRDIKADDHRLLVMKKDGERDGAYTEYRQPPKAERTAKTEAALADAVRDECLAAYGRKAKP